MDIIMTNDDHDGEQNFPSVSCLAVPTLKVGVRGSGDNWQVTLTTWVSLFRPMSHESWVMTQYNNYYGSTVSSSWRRTWPMTQVKRCSKPRVPPKSSQWLTVQKWRNLTTTYIYKYCWNLLKFEEYFCSRIFRILTVQFYKYRSTKYQVPKMTKLVVGFLHFWTVNSISTQVPTSKND
jgi:hypothetical protein